MSGGVAAQLHKLRETKPQLFDYYQSPDPHYAEVRKEIMDWIEKADKVLAVLATQQPKTKIRILNDTSKELLIRRPPTSHKVQPQKMMLEFVEGNEVFLKIWDGNVVLLSKDELGGGVEAT